MKNMFSKSSARVLALDVGLRRIGLALSDPLRITAQGLPTLQRTRVREDIAALAAIAAEREVVLFLLGNPLHMSGAGSRQGRSVRELGDRLQQRTGIPVQYWDERLTSVEANRVLQESGISLKKRKAAVDRLSAVLILQSWLEHHNAGAPGR
jgi:putative Holliday junction resolvase